MGPSGTIWDYPGLSGTIWDYMGLSGTILDYLRLSQTKVQVEARESKLLLFETFSLFFFLLLFFTRAITRGARAPKNITLLLNEFFCVNIQIYDNQFDYRLTITDP